MASLLSTSLSPLSQLQTLLFDRRNLYITLTLPILTYLTIRHTLSVLPSLLNPILSPSLPPILPAPPPPRGSWPPNPRRIRTPTGLTLQTYSWGPASAPLILFIHGISTPSPCLAPLAATLVRTSHARVVLFDLPGRGGSECPDPLAHDGAGRQDAGFFVACVKAVLAEFGTREGWERGGVRVVGYSLGGGIAAEVVAGLSGVGCAVRSLVLIAPGGLIRRERISWGSRVLCCGVLPGWVAEGMVRRRLVGVGFPRMMVPREVEERMLREGGGEAEEEFRGGYVDARNSHVVIAREGVEGEWSAANAVEQQVANHVGFVRAFISSMRHGPIHDRHETWRRIGERCREARQARLEGRKSSGLDEGKVLLLLGTQDTVILADELAEDAQMTMGEDNIKVVKVAGAGHDLPWVYSTRCAEEMKAFWNDP